MNIQHAINTLKPALEAYRALKESKTYKGTPAVQLHAQQLEALEILMDEALEILSEKGRINKGIAEMEGWEYVDNFSLWSNPCGQSGFVSPPDYFEGGDTLTTATRRLEERSPAGFTLYNQITLSLGIYPPSADTRARALYAAWRHVTRR